MTSRRTSGPDRILQVSDARWKDAQHWELQEWKRANRSGWLRGLGKRLVNRADVGDDWNHWWSGQFHGYEEIPQTLENAVELGCGPYTNIRLISAGRHISHIFCSDPLVREYVTFRGRWLAEAVKSGRVLIDDHPIEECPFATDYFDLVVMINVLDHVRDAVVGLRQALRITRPGGFLVVGQDLTDEEDLTRIPDDVGHPVRLPQDFLDSELLNKCGIRLHRVLPREEGRNPSAHCGTYLFIGTKRG